MKPIIAFALLLLLLCLVPSSDAQNVRYDAPFPSIASSTTQPFLVANIPPASPVISVCNSPANALPCTNYATTYTSSGSACPNGSQDTPQPQPSACQSTGDAQGNIGFWAPAGTYDYTVCIGVTCFGPYTITLSLSTASLPNFSTAGQAWLTPADLVTGYNQLSAGSISTTNNQVTCWQFSITYTITLRKALYYLSAAGAGGTTANFGIYSAAKAKLGEASFVGSITTKQSVSLSTSPLTLAPATYYFCGSTSSTVISGLGHQVATTTLVDTLNQNATYVGQASNSTSAGVMPATLGTLTNDSLYVGAPEVFFTP